MKLSEKKASTLRALSPEQLVEELVTLKREAFSLRFQQANGQLTNTAKRRDVRKRIATLFTVLQEKKGVV